MTELKKALADYRSALEAASVTALSEPERHLYRLLAIEFQYVERRYAETGDTKQCWTSIRNVQSWRELGILKSDASEALRMTYERLSRLAGGLDEGDSRRGAPT